MTLSMGDPDPGSTLRMDMKTGQSVGNICPNKLVRSFPVILCYILRYE